MERSPGAVPDSSRAIGCPVCGAERPLVVLDEVEFRDTRRERFRVVRCGSCDHLYTLPRPPAAALERYYPDTYYRARHAGKRKIDSSRHGGLRERLARIALRQHFGYPGPTPRTMARRLLSWPVACWLRYGRRTLDAIPWAGGGELCDFGCGNGAFLRLCRRRGWRVCGVDFNEKVAQWARERDGLEVVAGTWPGGALAGRTFDVITAWHVLEHLPDPAGWVRAAAGKLNPGGYLLVCCPDAGSWAFRAFGRDWYGLDVPRHLSHFTTRKMVELLSGARLAVERIRPQARRKTLHASARLRAARTGSPLWRALAASSLPWRPVARVTGWLGCADGVMVVARKPAAHPQDVTGTPAPPAAS